MSALDGLAPMGIELDVEANDARYKEPGKSGEQVHDYLSELVELVAHDICTGTNLRLVSYGDIEKLILDLMEGPGKTAVRC